MAPRRTSVIPVAGVGTALSRASVHAGVSHDNEDLWFTPVGERHAGAQA